MLLLLVLVLFLYLDSFEILLRQIIQGSSRVHFFLSFLKTWHVSSSFIANSSPNIGTLFTWHFCVCFLQRNVFISNVGSLKIRTWIFESVKRSFSLSCSIDSGRFFEILWEWFFLEALGNGWGLNPASLRLSMLWLAASGLGPPLGMSGRPHYLR